MGTVILILFLISLLFILPSSLKFRRRPIPLPPGPRGLPLVGNLHQIGSQAHRALHDMSDRYGSRGLLHLRFGLTDVIVVSSASAAEACFCNHDLNVSSRPRTAVGKYTAYNFRDFVMAPYGPRWRMLKRIFWQHLFSSKALDAVCNQRAEEVGQLVRDLVERSGSAFLICEPVNICVTNSLSRILVGRRVVAADESGSEFKKITEEMMWLGGQFSIGDFIPWIDWLDLQGYIKRMINVRERLGEFLQNLILERRKMTENQSKDGSCEIANDFLSVLLEMHGEVEGEQNKLTNIEIKALLQDMFIAGTDTITVLIEWILFELIRHPDILSRAQSEIDSLVGQNRLVAESDVPKFTLLHAIIKETFRLYPTAPLGVPRYATDDCQVNGYLIPKGAFIYFNIWSIGRDPEHWAEKPLEYIPDRFIAGSQYYKNVDVRGKDFELMPFGAGRRICAGMSHALRLISFITATLLHSFDWTLPVGQKADALDAEETLGVTLRKTNPLVVQAKLRLAPASYH